MLLSRYLRRVSDVQQLQGNLGVPSQFRALNRASDIEERFLQRNGGHENVIDCDSVTITSSVSEPTPFYPLGLPCLSFCPWVEAQH